MNVSNKQTDRLLTALGERPLPAQRLRQLLGNISPATLSRLVKLAGSQVITLGQARATHYARPRELRGIGWRFPAYHVDDTGDVHLIGELWVLQGGYWWQGTAGWKSKFYPHLPWFLQDMKPEGFIGSSFARFHGPRIGLPERLTDWKDDDFLIALVRRGEDMSGNLLLGDESVQRYLELSRKPAETAAIGDYPAWAEASLAGALSLSLVGGQQPKFCTQAKRAGIDLQVLVKFSPLVSTTAGQRWSDLLICEHIALGILRGSGIATAQSSIRQTHGRTFLELKRFDRSGRFGRSALHTLATVDDAFSGGSRKSWTNSADTLQRLNVLSSDDALRLRDLDLFGSLIANTERDFSNISLIPTSNDRCQFRLAPVYDMLPTQYRPRDGEELDWTPWQPVSASAWDDMHDYAVRFWAAAARDRRISELFRKLCRTNHDLLHRLEHGPRIVRSPW